VQVCAIVFEKDRAEEELKNVQSVQEFNWFKEVQMFKRTFKAFKSSNCSSLDTPPASALQPQLTGDLRLNECSRVQMLNLELL
jgi:hypothetical protein